MLNNSTSTSRSTWTGNGNSTSNGTSDSDNNRSSRNQNSDNSKNNKKPKTIKLSIKRVVLLRECSWWRELINKILQAVKNTIQRNIDPSWALQIELIL